MIDGPKDTKNGGEVNMKQLGQAFKFDVNVIESRKNFLNLRSMRTMSMDERRNYELNQFMELAKENKTGTIDPKDGSIVYYVIDHGWYIHWLDFIRNKREMPRDIENKNIKSFILSERTRKGSKTDSDQDLGLR